MAERKRGYGLFVWSELDGRWSAFVRSEVRSRVESIRDALVMLTGADVWIVQAPSVEPDDILAAGAALRAPRGVGFVDPAPGGVIEVVGELGELCEAIWLEVEFQHWKALTPFAKHRGAAVLEALRWCFVHWDLEARDRARAEVEVELSRARAVRGSASFH